MPRLTKEEREHKRLLNEADRDYPRTLARLKAVLGKVDESVTFFRTDRQRQRISREIKDDLAELVVLACSEQDAVTAREYRKAIDTTVRLTEKVALSMADAMRSEALKGLFTKEKR